jgi:5-oxoprolinase (ATP-hydrolysing)
MKPLKVIVPEGSVLNPVYPASVVDGNVETSICITNALHGALGTTAKSQCTMSNFTFGNRTYQYYESIAGGLGAGNVLDKNSVLVDGFNGTSVVRSQYAQLSPDRPRDPRASLPRALAKLRVPCELGWKRALVRWKRRRAANQLLGADDCKHLVKRT